MPFDPELYKKYDEYIVTEPEEGVRLVQMNNPKTLNAFKESTWRQFQAIFEDLDHDPETYVIVLGSSVAKSFSSGLNLKEAIGTFSKYADSKDSERYRGLLQHIKDFQFAIGAPARIHTPTIAAINGIAVGLGVDIASACTIRVATKDVKLSIREIKIGIPADIGSLQRMPSLVNNQSRLNELALTGEFFGAEEALSLGFISKILPDHQSALEHAINLATDIAGHQRWAIRGTKACIQQQNDNITQEEGLKFIADYNAQNIDGKFLNAMRGVFKL